jgi:(p)ppGpp synthase/HD superfamily hydrolase
MTKITRFQDIPKFPQAYYSITVSINYLKDTLASWSTRENELILNPEWQRGHIWTEQQQIAFMAGIRVNGIDDVGIVNNITRIISNELNVNMRSISFESQDGVFEGTIMVFVHDTNHLTELLGKIKEVKGVTSVHRIDSN